MEYTITPKEKRRQTNLLFQLWRVSVLSLKFVRLTRLGCARPGRAAAGEAGEADGEAARHGA